MLSSENQSVDAGDYVTLKREAFVDGMVILEIREWIRQDAARRRLAGENAPADGVERVADFIDYRLKENHLANNAVEKCSKKKNHDQGEDVPPTNVEAYKAQMLILEITEFIKQEGGRWRKDGNHAASVAVDRIASLIVQMKGDHLAYTAVTENAPPVIGGQVKKKRGIWTDEKLRKLWNMSLEPDMNKTKLAAHFGVTRQAIDKPLKRAEDKFSSKPKRRVFGL